MGDDKAMARLESLQFGFAAWSLELQVVEIECDNQQVVRSDNLNRKLFRMFLRSVFAECGQTGAESLNNCNNLLQCLSYERQNFVHGCLLLTSSRSKEIRGGSQISKR